MTAAAKRFSLGIDQAMDDSGWCVIIPRMYMPFCKDLIKKIVLLMSTYDSRFLERENECLILCNSFLETDLESKRIEVLQLPPGAKKKKSCPFAFYNESHGLFIHMRIQNRTLEGLPEYIYAQRTGEALAKLGEALIKGLKQAAQESRQNEIPSPSLLGCLEGLALKGSFHSQGAVVPLAMVYSSIFQQLIPVIGKERLASVNISSWKKRILGDGRADKKDSLAFARSLGAGEDVSEDEADAIALAFLAATASFSDRSLFNFGGRVMPKPKSAG